MTSLICVWLVCICGQGIEAKAALIAQKEIELEKQEEIEASAIQASLDTTAVVALPVRTAGAPSSTSAGPSGPTVSSPSAPAPTSATHSKGTISTPVLLEMLAWLLRHHVLEELHTCVLW